MPVPDAISKAFDENRDYIKLITGKPRKMRFMDFGTEHFFSEETKIFEGKDTTTIQFNSVADLEHPKKTVKTFRTTSEKLCRKLWGFFDRRIFDLEITRTGEGFETDYDIYPITAETETGAGPAGGETNDEKPSTS